MSDTTEGTTTQGTEEKQQTTTTPEGNSYTQEQLDKMFAERAKRAETSAVAKLLEGMGLKSPDELTALVQDAKKRQEAEMSEAQKLQTQLAKLEADKKAMADQLASEQQARIQDKVDAQIRAAAKGAHDANDVVMMARNQFTEQVTGVVNADGSIEDKKVVTLIEAIRKAKPHLFGSVNPGSPSNRDGKPPEPDAKVKELGRAALQRQIKSSF